MTYKLNDIDIRTYGAVPSQPDSDSLALTGIFDLPARVGETSRSWGTSIEPFVDQEDIALDGRTLSLWAYFPEKADISPYLKACKECSVLSCDIGSFIVLCKDAIEVRDHGFKIVIAKFWQYNYKPVQWRVITKSFEGEYLIDGYDLFRDFNIVVERGDSPLSVADRIDVGTTEVYKITTYRGERALSISCTMIASSIRDMYQKMQSFQVLLMQPGLRTLTIKGTLLNAYFKDGLTASLSHPNFLKFTIKATVI